MRTIVAAGLALFAAGALAQVSSGGLVNGLRGPAALDAETRPPPLHKPVNDDQRRARSYPMQPPVIPHQIDNYQIDLRFNKCMSCHGRERTGESQAPMVSVTHFQDRGGNVLLEISARRYFCTACHVAQYDVRAPVKNTFQDFYDLKAAGAPAAGKAR
jgi:cytochrome c-type protein NapB